MLSSPHNITQKSQLKTFTKALLTQYPRGVFYLYGDLGAGKTTFAQTLLKTLGYDGIVQSPTYSIMNEYQLFDGSIILHADLYRLAEPEELLYLDVREWQNRARFILIEWAQHGIPLIPAANLELHFKLQSSLRTVECHLPENNKAL